MGQAGKSGTCPLDPWRCGDLGSYAILQTMNTVAKIMKKMS